MKKISLMIIEIIMVITMMSCGNNTNYIAHNGEYTTIENIFDTLNYLKYINDPMNYEKTKWDEFEIEKINLKYEDNTLWLWNKSYDVHRYDNVIYKDINTYDEINGLKTQEYTVRVYYYKDTEIIIIKTIFNIKNNKSFEFLSTENMAFYNKINETLDEYEKKLKNIL